MTKEAGERSFDELARALASGAISRRKALKLMGTALLGGTLASIPGVAWATHKGTSHGGGGNPAQGRCPAGTTNCQGKCINLQTNQDNCGQCRVVCSQGELCQGGMCVRTEGAVCSSSSQCAARLSCRNGICAPAFVCSTAEVASCAASGPALCCATPTHQICCPTPPGFTAQCRTVVRGDGTTQPECVLVIEQP